MILLVHEKISIEEEAPQNHTDVENITIYDSVIIAGNKTADKINAEVVVRCPSCQNYLKYNKDNIKI